jgi:hypothetical protein
MKRSEGSISFVFGPADQYSQTISKATASVSGLE